MRLGIRNLFAWLALSVVLGLLAYQFRALSVRSVLTPEDFCEYWAAGKLNLEGGDPYSGRQLLPLQQAVGWKEDYPVYMYNPPWTLTFVMPFALLPFRESQLLWLLMHLAIVVACADCVWHLYGGATSQRWVAWAVALLFVPSMICLKMGQIPPLVLLGLTGFLYFQRARRDTLAGAFLMLTAIKPQLVYLVGVAVVLWVLQTGRWRVLLGGVAALLVTTVIPWAINPEVIHQYRQGLSDSPPTAWITTTFGALLRASFHGRHSWLQFVPPALGLAWLGWYWLRRRTEWDWMRELPLLMVVSIVTTFFAWLGDQVVLVPVVVCCAVWIAQRGDRRGMLAAVLLFLVVNGLLLLIGHLTQNQLVYLWVAPLLLICFVLLRRSAQSLRGERDNFSPTMTTERSGG